MWGEIEPRVTTEVNVCEKLDKNEQQPEVSVVASSHSCTQQTLQKTQGQGHVKSRFFNAMIEAVAQSGSLVKSQQIGDAELTLEERREELLCQYRSKPLVFLERYHACLKPQHLSAFVHVSSDPRAQHYSKVIRRRAAECTNRTRVRNQRYAALRALQKEGEYFSEEQMRMRAPLLYEQYIGRYLTDEEVLERSQEAMLDGSKGDSGTSAGGAGGLAHLLLNSYQEGLIQNRLQEEQEEEECAQEEEEDDEEDDDNGVHKTDWEPTPEEKALLREEFISQMHQHFLDGKDKDFNYSEVDENPDYDNLDIVSRDAEDKYFDEDEEEEEEEEEEDTEEDITDLPITL
ncbi:coiled-coil domain-containing protein 97 isoform X2 [Cynoglossus semilaevis]|uniref:Coiled-coil domain containing 97 n=1 Tax=Cynoglossus semilaevis TaxID=244447 RepID=A0A3P8WV28_CYNSE|nr:coiled-coil domain-containing protein 97 isoform X2 [Cynoglossus semilaevis]